MSQVLTLYTTPVIYLAMERLKLRLTGTHDGCPIAPKTLISCCRLATSALSSAISFKASATACGADARTEVYQLPNTAKRPAVCEACVAGANGDLFGRVAVAVEPGQWHQVEGGVQVADEG